MGPTDGNRPRLLFLEPLRHPQRVAVLRHNPDDIVRDALRHVGLDLDGDVDLGAVQSGQVLDDLGAEVAGFGGDAERSQAPGGVVAPDDGTLCPRLGRLLLLDRPRPSGGRSFRQ
ncbi:MAG TPA: hypothetical protein VFB58_15240 [Chloroflexota bacterium]|nr:hypothetical protein [Chloroflexota bacterium]